MQISKSTLKKLIKEAALEYINSQQNLLAEKDLPAKPGDKDEEERKKAIKPLKMMRLQN